MKHLDRRPGDAGSLSEHTLSDTAALRPCKADSPSGNPPNTPTDRPVEPGGHPRCNAPADYRIPKGATQRTFVREFNLCVDCLEQYLANLKTSITLAGEPCEWHDTLLVIENLFDGGLDYLPDLLRDHCEHRACLESLKERVVGLSDDQEVSA